MPRHNARWRDDRLGSLVRSGLSDVRTASPSPGVWDRIEASIEPQRGHGRVRRAVRWFSGAAPGGGHGALGVPWLLLPGSAALAVLLMIGTMRDVPPAWVQPIPDRGNTLAQDSLLYAGELKLDASEPRTLSGDVRARGNERSGGAGDGLAQVEVPQRWSRFQLDHYQESREFRGPTDWLAAPEIALTY